MGTYRGEGRRVLALRRLRLEHVGARQAPSAQQRRVLLFFRFAGPVGQVRDDTAVGHKPGEALVPMHHKRAGLLHARHRGRVERRFGPDRRLGQAVARELAPSRDSARYRFPIYELRSSS